MKNIHSIEFYTGTKEELLPDFSPEFPYIASRVELDKYPDRCSPWHWHKAVELFYVESGELEYFTPKERCILSAGSGGMVNSNILHRTKAFPHSDGNIELIHIFDPSLLAGEQASRIEQKYILPLISASQYELFTLFPDNPQQAKILKLILEAFRLSPQEFGYEIRLRAALSEIWLLLFSLYPPLSGSAGKQNINNDKIKLMMIYVHEHYAEKLSVSDLAASAYLSERECYRTFNECLHMTPVEYITGYRLQAACQMLARGKKSVTSIGYACGLGSNSYFGRIFKERMGCTPLEYRRIWQNNDINRR